MILPQQDDYIDIHTHNADSAAGHFFVENLMAHEDRIPSDLPDVACSFGIHPWNLNESNIDKLINRVNAVTCSPNMIAIGEAGFDKLKGPAMATQSEAFERQIVISEKSRRPVIIHCVKAWDELLHSLKKTRPEMPWLIHGFRGSIDLAGQLLSKGIYLSFWFDFVIRPESADLLRSVPRERIFLETDGADVNIRDIYNKVSGDLDLSVVELKKRIHSNFNVFFKI